MLKIKPCYPNKYFFFNNCPNRGGKPSKFHLDMFSAICSKSNKPDD